MRNLPRWLPFLLLALGWAPAQAAGDCPGRVRIGYSDYGSARLASPAEPPPGWETQAVLAAAQRLGCELEFVGLPSRRLSVALEQGDVDFGLLYSINPERLRRLRFPLDAQGLPDLAWAPAFGNLVLFSRADTPADPGWDGRQLDPRWRVGAVAGSLHETLARQRAWRVEPVALAESDVGMLQARRFDVLLTTRESLSPEQRAGLVEWAPVVARLPFFMPASPVFANRHPAWTRRLWNEFCAAVRRAEPEVRPVDCGIAPPAALR